MVAWEILKNPGLNFLRLRDFAGESDADFEKYIHDVMAGGFGEAGKRDEKKKSSSNCNIPSVNNL